MNTEPIPAIDSIYQRVREILDKARENVFYAVNYEMVLAYWNIGREIVQAEQRGDNRAEYGKKLISEISRQLTMEYGKGFDQSNVWNMRQFYRVFPIPDALRRELSWTHYRHLMRVEKSDARDFYLQEAITGNWSTRQLERQINSLYFERLSLSRNKKGMPAGFQK